ncbi:MAG TPA: hypothetical protein VIL85_23835 [Thermomicrobiales bacterium]
MPAIHAVCCSCETYSPVAMIATVGLGQGRALPRVQRDPRAVTRVRRAL